jgi:VanZ family protein
MNNINTQTRLLPWLLVFVVFSLILYFSNQPFKAQDLRPILEKHQRLLQVVQRFPYVSFAYDAEFIDSKADPAGFIQFGLRKGMHVFLYGLLGLTLMVALNGRDKKRPWLAVLVLLLVAACDEWHQLSVPGRTGRLLDVLLDFGGFLLFITVFGLLKRDGGSQLDRPA